MDREDERIEKPPRAPSRRHGITGRHWVKKITPAVLAANRANAKKSTGPKTPEGKEIASQNATWHGLRGSRVVMKHERPEEYNAMAATLYAVFDAQGTYEHQIVKRMADWQWQLDRLVAMDTHARESQDFRDRMEAETHRLNQEMMRLERAIIRCRKELTEVQRLRGKRFGPDSPDAGRNLDTPETLFLTHGDYLGPVPRNIPTQAEVAYDSLVSEMIRKVEARHERSPDRLDRYLEKMADYHLAVEGIEAPDPPDYPPDPAPVPWTPQPYQYHGPADPDAYDDEENEAPGGPPPDPDGG